MTSETLNDLIRGQKMDFNVKAIIFQNRRSTPFGTKSPDTLVQNIYDEDGNNSAENGRISTIPDYWLNSSQRLGAEDR